MSLDDDDFEPDPFDPTALVVMFLLAGAFLVMLWVFAASAHYVTVVPKSDMLHPRGDSFLAKTVKLEI